MEQIKELINNKKIEIMQIQEKLKTDIDQEGKNQLQKKLNELLDEKLKLVEIASVIYNKDCQLENNKIKKDDKKDTNYPKPIKRKFDTIEEKEDSNNKNNKVDNFKIKKKDGYLMI